MTVISVKIPGILHDGEGFSSAVLFLLHNGNELTKINDMNLPLFQSLFQLANKLAMFQKFEI